MMHHQILVVRVAEFIFLVVCLAHVLRLIFKVKVTIGTVEVPLWVSKVGAVVSLLLALWLISA